MTLKIADFMNVITRTVGPLDGLQKARRIMSDNCIDCLPVIDNGKVIGILSLNDIINSHPNRIVADAMSSHVISVSPEAHPWETNKLFKTHKIDNILIIKNDKPIGVINKALLDARLDRYVDLLTGLHQRHYFYFKGFELLECKQDVCVIFIDLNDFGMIDKQYGHVVGDMILKEVSFVLMANVPSECLLCRYAGDEFAILSNNPLSKCAKLAAKTLDILSQHTFYQNIQVTACAGLAAGRASESDNREKLYQIFSEIINQASLASTQAKNENKRIVISSVNTSSL